MKLGELVQARGAIGKVYNAPPAVDGETFLKLKRLVKKMIGELDEYEKAKNECIKKTGKDSVGPADPGFADVVKFIADMEKSEVDIKVEPILTDADMLAMRLSIAEQDALERLGMVKGEEEKKIAK